MNNFYNLTSTEFSAAVIVFNILFSFVLLLAVVWVYKRTHKGLSYSPSFVFTLIMVGILGCAVMMVVRNNIIGAFALLGAFSIIRFRTILKETRDIAFVFFALVVGVSVGTSNYALAIATTAIVGCIVLALHRYKVDSATANLGYILTFNARDGFDVTSLRPALSGMASDHELLQTRTAGAGLTNYVLSLQLKESFDAAAVVAKLRTYDILSDIEVITGEHTIEY